MKEVWKDIYGYKGYYQVSNLGRVRSLDREIKYVDGRRYKYKGKILSPGEYRGGYLHVVLTKNSKGQVCKVHQLVLLAFAGLRGKREANHLDGDRKNNRLDNLEWATKKQNNAHRVRSGRHYTGTGCPWSVVTPEQVQKIRHLKSLGLGTTRISKELKLNISTVGNIYYGKSHIQKDQL